MSVFGTIILPLCLIIGSAGMFLIGIAIAESQSLRVTLGKPTSSHTRSNHDHASMVIMGENTIYDNILEYIDNRNLDSGCYGPRAISRVLDM